MTNSKREVVELLKDLGIKWSYEHPVFVWGENKRPRVWAPDFYLIPFGIYLEVCGSANFDYDYRRKIFDNNGFRVIFLHLYTEPYKWTYHLIRYLQLFTNSRYNKLSEILRKENIIDIWNKEDFCCYNRKFKKEELKDDCKDCKYGKSCKGGCLAVSTSMTGKMHCDPFCLYQIEKQI